MRKQHTIWLLTLLLLVGLTGCAQSTRTARISADWSRGVQIGISTSGGRPALALSAEENLLLAAWPAQPDPDGPRVLHLLALDTASGEVTAERDLPISSCDPLAPALTPARGGGFHLTWLEGPYSQRGLYHRLLAPTGDPAGPVSRISPSGQQVLEAQVASLPDGGLAVLWTTRSGPALLLLDESGHPRGVPLLLPGALSAGMAVDEQGNVHLAWLTQESATHYPIHYGLLLPDALSLPASRTVAIVLLSPSQTADDIDGPVVAVEQDGVYVAWSRMAQTMGGQAEQAAFVFVSGETAGELQPLAFPSSFPPAYAPVEGIPGLNYLAPPTRTGLGNGSVRRAPVALPGQGERTLLALSLEGQTRSKDILQPALAVLDDGEVQGYTVVAWTDHPSIGIAAVSDPAGNLYVAWSDITGIPSEHPVYLATTASGPRSTFDHLSPMDVLASLLDAAQRAVQGLAFIITGTFWLMLPLAWLFAALWLGGGELGNRAARLVLLVAAMLHWASKFFLTPDLLTMLPRLAYAPPALAPLIVVLTPLLTVTLGLLVARLFYLRRRDEVSPLIAYLFVAATDLTISLALIGLANTE